MSQSPRHAKEDDAEQLRYGRAWLALNTMLRNGRSFSGRERNRCFLNIGSGKFANVSSVTGLGFADDGRAVAAIDWDFDGDLDLWTTNRTTPRIRFLSNELPSGNRFVAIHLQGVTSNRDAIGARVELYLGPDGRQKRVKSLRAGDAFLSQSTKWIHFGLGDHDQIDRLVVRWPGGREETFGGLLVDQFTRIVEGSGKAEPIEPPRLSSSSAPPLEELDHSSHPTTSAPQQRIVLLSPVPIPSLQYRPLHQPDADMPLHRGRPLLLGLWATWCEPCIAELKEWAAQYDQLTAAGLHVAALCVDNPEAGSEPVLEGIASLAERLSLPFDVGTPQEGLVTFLDMTQRTFVFAQRPLPLPCSFLIDAKGRVAVVYKGAVPVDQVIDDSRILEADPDAVVASAIPYPGRWLEYPGPMPLRRLVLALYESGQKDTAKSYLGRLIEIHESMEGQDDELVRLYRIQGAMLSDDHAVGQAIVAFQNVLRLAPRDHQAHMQLANLAISGNDLTMAEKHLAAALEVRPNNASLLHKYGSLKQRRGETREAVELFRRSLALRSDSAVHFALGNSLIATGHAQEAIVHFDEALKLRPGWPPAANNLAWILATHPDDTIRDGQRAVELATNVCKLSNHSVPEFLTTLAAALAETGRFDEASEVAQSALSLAQQSKKTQLAAKARAQLQRYRNQQPLRSD